MKDDHRRYTGYILVRKFSTSNRPHPLAVGLHLLAPLKKYHTPRRESVPHLPRLLVCSLLSLSLSVYSLTPNIYLIRPESALARPHGKELKTSTHTRHTMVTHTRPGNIKLTPTRTPRAETLLVLFLPLARSFSHLPSAGRPSLSRMDSNTFFESEGQATRP